MKVKTPRHERRNTRNFSISIPFDIFDRLEERVRVSKSTRSEYIQRCLMRYLEGEGADSIIPSVPEQFQKLKEGESPAGLSLRDIRGAMDDAVNGAMQKVLDIQNKRGKKKPSS